jgi:hypothetical protein
MTPVGLNEHVETRTDVNFELPSAHRRGSAPSAGDGPISAASPGKTLELGYQLTPNLSVAGFLEHMSNADLAAHNAGLTDAGARVGLKF